MLNKSYNYFKIYLKKILLTLKFWPVSFRVKAKEKLKHETVHF